MQKLDRIQSSPAFELDLCNRLLLRRAQRKKGVNFTQIWNSTFEILSKYEKAKRVTLGKHVMSSVGTSPVFIPCPCGYKNVLSLLVSKYQTLLLKKGRIRLHNEKEKIR